MTTSLWDRIRDWVILLVLLAISLSVFFLFNEPAIRGLRASALEVTARVEGGLEWAGGYFRALEENSKLRTSNIQLSSELARLRQAQQENARLKALLSLRDSSTYDFLAARIVASDLNREQNHFTLDVGSNDGVAIDMAVVDDQGILGRIVLISPNYARVMSYLNIDFHAPARLQRLGTDGMVSWQGERRDRLIMEYVPKTEAVQPGDLVVTSGYSAIFPPGYSIGIVDSVATQPGRGELLIFLTPTAPLYKAEHAFVILKRPDPERRALETLVGR